VLMAYGLVGWALCGGTMGVLMSVAPLRTALAVHGVAAPLFFIAISWLYFRRHDAAPVPTAAVWTAMVASLDAVVVAGSILGSWEMFTSLLGTWVPFGLIFLATWATGAAMSTGSGESSRRRAAA